jgi:hypothetical protein
MNKPLLVWICALAAATVSVAASADKTPPQKDSAAPVAKAAPKASKAVRLTDAELDRVTAAGADVIINGPGLTIIDNPGNNVIFKQNRNHLVCINCL